MTAGMIAVASAAEAVCTGVGERSARTKAGPGCAAGKTSRLSFHRRRPG